MSAGIYWQPKRKGKSLGVNAPSSFLGMLERAFGQQQPHDLDTSQLERLRGMAAGCDDAGHRAALEELIEAIEKHSQIRVWAEY